MLPLHGLVAAVKDNIDVAGLPTTAGAPSYSYVPGRDASCVARLRAAGAVVLGKTNMDQFATGLAGTRTPFGPVRCAADPGRISGGSSAGSAVAVALGLADIALGTDTAGSGRVPAALNGIVGVKPTRGLIPATGVVPACRTLDCVSVFARGLPLARRVTGLLAGPDGRDPLARFRASRALSGPPRVAVPLDSQLAGLAPGWAEAFAAAAGALRAAGAQVLPADISPLLEAATLLYGGAFVAERYAAVGAHIAEHAALIGTSLDPVVARIILDGAKPTAARYFADRERLDLLAARADAALAGADALLTPTTTAHPAIAEALADPELSARLGRFTNFANLLDMASLAVPAGTAGGLPFGVMLSGPAGSDDVLAQIAALLDAVPVELLVVGAHLSGQPLNHELLAAGGVLIGPAATAGCYRLYALDTEPAKPGLVRVPGDGGGSIDGEVWRLPAVGFARFMSGVAAPMTVGRVRLAAGGEVLGFLCEPAAVAGAADITRYGGWRAWQDRPAEPPAGPAAARSAVA